MIGSSKQELTESEVKINQSQAYWSVISVWRRVTLFQGSSDQFDFHSSILDERKLAEKMRFICLAAVTSQLCNFRFYLERWQLWKTEVYFLVLFFLNEDPLII